VFDVDNETSRLAQGYLGLFVCYLTYRNGSCLEFMVNIARNWNKFARSGARALDRKGSKENARELILGIFNMANDYATKWWR
jgi:hypothetical protein